MTPEQQQSWDCEAYGPDGPAAARLCFYADPGTRNCRSHAECQQSVAGARRMTYNLMLEGAAAGDPAATLLAATFTSPDQPLRWPVTLGGLPYVDEGPVGGEPVSSETPPLVRALLDQLPPEGEPFPAAARARWLGALRALTILLYPSGDDESADLDWWEGRANIVAAALRTAAAHPVGSPAGQVYQSVLAGLVERYGDPGPLFPAGGDR
jgi:hypothetical protein